MTIEKIFGELIVNNTLYSDLEIFQSHNNDEHTIFNRLNHTYTQCGKYKLKEILSQFTNDIAVLKRRQNNTKIIYKNYDILKLQFQKLNEYEADILELWDELPEEIQAFYDIVYFNFPFNFVNDICNKNEMLLQYSNLYNIWCAPLFNVAIPLLTVVIPYLLYIIGKYILKYDIPTIPISTFISFIFKFMFSSYLNNGIINARYAIYIGIFVWLIFYCINSYQSIKSAYDTYININKLHQKINRIRHIISIANECNNVYPMQSIDKQELDYFNDLLGSDLFEAEPYIWSNKGKILYTYRIISESKDKLIPILKYLGEIDALLSILNLIRNHKYTFAKYIENAENPSFTAKGLWHPAIKSENIVYNDISLNKNKYLITGPNKAGKSTYIKSAAIAVLLSQTFGIVNANACIMTPYKTLHTHLHIPDKTGYESLFEAELKRVHREIDELDKGEYMFIIMDEILTSTNYVEGYAAAYAIAKKLSEYNNANIMITTHYTGLSKLGGQIQNYHFGLVDGKYDYKIKEGITDQFVALELLKNEFKDDMKLIEDANKIAENLQKEKLSLKI